MMNDNDDEDEPMMDVEEEEQVEDDEPQFSSKPPAFVEIRYSFERCPYTNQNTILGQIEAAKEELSKSCNTKLDTFQLKDMIFNERTAFAVMEMFQYCFQSGITWETLIIDTCIQNGLFHQVLTKALEFSLFQSIEFICEAVDLDEMGILSMSNVPPVDEFSKRTASILRDVTQGDNDNDTGNEDSSSSVEDTVVGLFFRGFSMEPRSALSFLSHGPVYKRGRRRISTTLSRLEFNDVRIGYTHQESDIAIDVLSQYLSTNRTLNTLVIKDLYPLSDVQLAKLVLSLLHHPSLTTLILEAVPWHDETLKALGQLLASSSECALQNLYLGERTIYEDGDPNLQPNPGKPNLQNLVHNLAPKCTSILSINLSDCQLDNDDFRLLMYSLWRFPNLKTLDLSYNLITSFDLTTTFRSTTKSKSCNLRHFDMTGNPVFCDLDNSKQRQYLTNILHATLGLGKLERLLDTNAFHHINEYVEKIRRETDNRLESGLLSADDVIYSLLHGPIFAGRGSVSSITTSTI